MSDNGLPGFRAGPKNNIADARGEAWGGKGKGIRERERKKRKEGDKEGRQEEVSGQRQWTIIKVKGQRKSSGRHTNFVHDFSQHVCCH